MRITWITKVWFVAAVPAFASIPFDCSHHLPLQTVIDYALPGETILIHGTCSGPLLIKGKHLTLAGEGGAILNGQGNDDVITVIGPAHLTLRKLTVQNGNNGINASAGAQLSLVDTTVQKNALMGILLTGDSSATLSGAVTNGNTVNGLDAEGSSAVIVNGTYQSNSNGVFGININGSSSLTLTRGQVLASENTLGIQIGTSASAFISDPASSITVTKNATTGLTVVSGGHMVDFGGAILATDNGVHGVSVDSKAGLDLDAAGNLTSNGNTQDGVHLEETSVMTIFNTAAFSGVQGNTTLNASGNFGNGVSILTGSNLTVIHQAAVNSVGNNGDGIMVDNGSSVTLIQSNIASNGKGIVLTFGSRGDITSSTVQHISCDATVLLRGDTGVRCPHSFK